jgi:hypothetical protein
MIDYRTQVAWITDVGSRPSYGVWPAMRLDDRMLADYESAFALQSRLGLDHIIIWGIFVSRDWPIDLARAVSPARMRAARQLIEAAHRHGVKVLAGLGVYSWGFEEIIRAHPGLSGGNPRALCPSNPESWRWQQMVTDWLFESSEVDGVSMQSADQGRCPCEKCARWGPVEYHARLNAQVATYIKERWPGRLVSANTWPTSIQDPADLPHVLEFAQGSDFVIDVFSTASHGAPDYRARLVAALAEIGVAYGTNGGACVRPPQHWQHLRWFIPTLRVAAEHVARLHADGGRAAEIFCRTPDNPSDEVSFRVHCALLGDPERPLEPLVADVIADLYNPRTAFVRDALADLFVRAERAFFERWQPPRLGAPIYLERLSIDRPGEPTYLTQQMSSDGLHGYERDLEALRDEVDRLMPEVGDQARLRRVGYSIDGALGDVAHALRVVGAVSAEPDRLPG